MADVTIDDGGIEGRGAGLGTGAARLTDEAVAHRVAADGRLTEGEVISLWEERVTVGKRRVEAGTVRVSTHVETFTDTARATLDDEVIEVERTPVGRFVDQAEGPREEADATVLPVYEERLVVEKRLFLVEEVRLRRRRQSREVELPVELRRQVARVDRLPPDAADMAAPTIPSTQE